MVLKQDKKSLKLREFGNVGLCGIVKLTDCKDLTDLYTFREYLFDVHKNHKVFYTYDHKKTHMNNQFHWPLPWFQARLNWLDKRIEIEQIKVL